MDAEIAPAVAHHLAAMRESAWSDQDFGSGGPVYVASAHAVLAAGKDGILYTGNAAALGDTQPGDLQAGHFAANYAKLKMPPILYTFFDPTVPPAPDSPTQLKSVSGRRDAASARHAAAVFVGHAWRDAYRRRREQRVAGVVDCGRRHLDLSRRVQRDCLAAIAASIRRHARLEHHARRQQRG